MELIDRYVAEVGRNLPEKMRPDIERELRSLLEDMLDDRSQAAGRAPDEAMVVEMLKEYGSPQKVAGAYGAPRYLVGPALYPTFMAILKPVLAVIAVVVVITFGVSASRGGLTLMDLGRVMLESLNNLWQAGIGFFGILVLIFAIIERTSPKLEVKEEEWDPRKLKPAVPESSKAKPGELIAGIVMNVIVLVLFNAYTDRLGLYIFNNVEWRFIPIFTQTFFSYIPWFSALWALEIALNAWVLRDGRWQAATRWFYVILSALGAVLALVMLTGPAILAVTPETLAAMEQAGFTPDLTNLLDNGVQLSVRLVLAFILIGKTVDFGKGLYRLLFQREA